LRFPKTTTISASSLQKTSAKARNLPSAEGNLTEPIVGNRVATSPNQNPISGPTTNTTTAGADGESSTACTGSKSPTGAGIAGRVNGGPNSK
jgi:hypothetical protein